MDGQIPLEHDYMEDEYMEIEIPLGNHDMDGKIRLENDDMEDDYMEIKIPLDNHYVDGQIPLETWRIMTWTLKFL